MFAASAAANKNVFPLRQTAYYLYNMTMIK